MNLMISIGKKPFVQKKRSTKCGFPKRKCVRRQQGIIATVAWQKCGLAVENSQQFSALEELLHAGLTFEKQRETFIISLVNFANCVSAFFSNSSR